MWRILSGWFDYIRRESVQYSVVYHFEKIIRVMICEMVEDSITWLNKIPRKYGISEHLSP